MHITDAFERHGPFLRRRDLLALGFTDAHIRAALALHLIFRVRHGWYARPSIADDAARAIRVGGRLTGISALRSYGFVVPHVARTQLIVPRNSCRLRRPGERRERLRDADGCDIRWSDSPRLTREPASWRVTVEEALADVLAHESAFLAIACLDAVRMTGALPWQVIGALVEAAPARARGWLSLSAPARHPGETELRLFCWDRGIPFAPLVFVPGVGEVDGQAAAHSYVELDGAQHAEDWSGDSPSSFEHDHERDLALTIDGDRVLRITHRQLHRRPADCAAALWRLIDDDRLLTAARRRHPYKPPKERSGSRKRRRIAATILASARLLD